MFKQQYMGITRNVGYSICSKILEVQNNSKNYCQVLHRSVVLVLDLNKAFETKMLLFPKDKFFPTVIKNYVPSNIQRVGNLDATPDVLTPGGRQEVKRIKVNAKGAQVPQKPEEVVEMLENEYYINLWIERDTIEEEPPDDVGPYNKDEVVGGVG